MLLEFNNILVSVVIPNYNCYDTLKRALESVVNQTHDRLEIIVVDDGSQDVKRVTSIVHAFDDPRIKLIALENNSGGSRARNVGIRHAVGKYIAFLDSDDAWHISKIEKQIECAEKCGKESILVYCRSRIISKHGSEVKPDRGIKPNENFTEYRFVGGGFIPTPSIFVDRKSALTCLFDEELRRHQDHDFIFKLVNHGVAFVFIDDTLVNVYWDSDKKLIEKGWSIDQTLNVARKYAHHFTQKAIGRYLFVQAICPALENYGIVPSARFFFDIYFKNRFFPKKPILDIYIALNYTTRIFKKLLNL